MKCTTANCYLTVIYYINSHFIAVLTVVFIARLTDHTAIFLKCLRG